MHITMVGAECAPVAKVGDLGEVIHGLSRELAKQGNEVEVVLPKHDCLRLDLVEDLHRVDEGLQVPFYDQFLPCNVECGHVDGIRCFFIDPQSEHGFFNRGHVYGEADDIGRYGFFSRAVLEFLLKTGDQPDVIHCHDWHTALVPVLRWEVFDALGLTHPRICHTLHNLTHQGIAGDYILRAVGLDPVRLMTADRLLDWGEPHRVNLVKGAISYASFLTTVSPHHAWEVQHTDQGRGLQEALRRRGDRFRGLLNGIDEGIWNPRSDPHIAHNYGPESLPKKAQNKSTLRRQLGLEEAAKPLVSILSRLDSRKGLELMRHAIGYALGSGCQMVLLGSAPETLTAEPQIADLFLDIKRQAEGHADCHLELGFDEELAHQIYAAADIMVIPSVQEPCGLTQMIAMKYGVVPVAHRVGGLADTVFDANYSDKAFEERTGFLFDAPTAESIEHALGRAIQLWFKHPEYFRQLRLNGMRADHSWSRPAQQYLKIFDSIKA